MAKLNFNEELEKVRRKATHKATRKFIKKRKLEVTTISNTSQGCIYDLLKQDSSFPGGHRPFSIKVKERHVEKD